MRCVSLSKLRLQEDSICYDVGAGTGSVSIEIARAGEQIRVYAIEKNPEGVELIDQNRKKFRTDGVRIIEGLAPHAMEDLEVPTHAFKRDCSITSEEKSGCTNRDQCDFT